MFWIIFIVVGRNTVSLKYKGLHYTICFRFLADSKLQMVYIHIYKLYENSVMLTVSGRSFSSNMSSTVLDFLFLMW